MAKNQAEWSNRFSVFFLKKHGYLNKKCSYQSGSISWTYGLSENKSSIGFTVRKDNWGTPQERTYINLQYSHTDRWSGKKESMNYNVDLATTPCNYGGIRYWFICPLFKNGQYCGRRVGVIYSIGKWFGCRHCGDIAYQSQFEGGNFRICSVCEPDVEKAYNEVKRMYYNGKLTRRYRRYLRLRDKVNNSWSRMAARLDKRFGRFAGLKK